MNSSKSVPILQFLTFGKKMTFSFSIIRNNSKLYCFAPNVEFFVCFLESSDPAQQKEKIQCDACSYVATSVGNMRQHVRAVHAGVRYPCLLCSYKATRAHDLARHKAAKHPTPVPETGKDAEWQDNGTSPQYLAEPDQEVIQDDRLTNGDSSLASGGGVQYACSGCRYQAGSHRAIRRHIVTRHSDLAFACSLCDFLAADRGRLNEHIDRQHNCRRQRQRSCTECGFNAIRPADLKRHMKETHADSFDSDETLQKVDAGNSDNFVKDLMDEEDEKDFSHSDNDNSVSHDENDESNESRLADTKVDSPAVKRRRRTKEIDWLQCAHCAYRTVRKNELRLHQQAEQHAGGAAVCSCDLCEYSCQLPSSLRQHKLTVHSSSGVGYPCGQCAHLASSPETLRDHVRKVRIAAVQLECAG